jgi:hypothetical protein
MADLFFYYGFQGAASEFSNHLNKMELVKFEKALSKTQNWSTTKYAAKLKSPVSRGS